LLVADSFVVQPTVAVLEVMPDAVTAEIRGGVRSAAAVVNELSVEVAVFPALSAEAAMKKYWVLCASPERGAACAVVSVVLEKFSAVVVFTGEEVA
jgi:hypothetical protein